MGRGTIRRFAPERRQTAEIDGQRQWVEDTPFFENDFDLRPDKL
jgi:hypothetical protein